MRQSQYTAETFLPILPPAGKGHTFHQPEERRRALFPIRRKTVNDLGANTDRAQNGNRPRYRIKLEKRTYQMLGIFNCQICNRSGNNQQDQSENNLFAQRIIRIKKNLDLNGVVSVLDRWCCIPSSRNRAQIAKNKRIPHVLILSL